MHDLKAKDEATRKSNEEKLCKGELCSNCKNEAASVKVMYCMNDKVKEELIEYYAYLDGETECRGTKKRLFEIVDEACGKKKPGSKSSKRDANENVESSERQPSTTKSDDRTGYVNEDGSDISHDNADNGKERSMRHFNLHNRAVQTIEKPSHGSHAVGKRSSELVECMKSIGVAGGAKEKIKECLKSLPTAQRKLLEAAVVKAAQRQTNINQQTVVEESVQTNTNSRANDSHISEPELGQLVPDPEYTHGPMYDICKPELVKCQLDAIEEKCPEAHALTKKLVQHYIPGLKKGSPAEKCLSKSPLATPTDNTENGCKDMKKPHLFFLIGLFLVGLA